MEWMFTQPNMEPLFGRGFTQWNIYEMAQADSYIATCRRELYPRGRSPATEAGKKALAGFQIAASYLNGEMTRADGYPIDLRIYQQFIK